jgi:hypothetical protein
MDKSKCLEVFNTQLKKFISELSSIYPTLQELKIIKTKLNTLYLASDKVVIMTFNQAVVNEFNDKIMNKDEKFFLDMDLSGTPLEEFNQLKNVYTQSSDNTKNVIWKYVHLLTKLAKKYSSF